MCFRSNIVKTLPNHLSVLNYKNIYFFKDVSGIGNIPNRKCLEYFERFLQDNQGCCCYGFPVTKENKTEYFRKCPTSVLV